MGQGRGQIYKLLQGEASWPPVVVPFGLDPFGWHGEQDSYRDVCDYALKNCTLLPKVFPFSAPLSIGSGNVSITCDRLERDDESLVRKYKLTGIDHLLWMEEIQTPGDTSWKTVKRWIENEEDLVQFLALDNLSPPECDLVAIREKECQVGGHGMPYAEVLDPFFTVSDMFKTDQFYIMLLTDRDRINQLIKHTARRILTGIERLCKDTGCPFILRLIGAEMAVPPFLRRSDFVSFEQDFYQQVCQLASRYEIPTAFHCHGPVRDIMDIVWNWGFNFFEPFEPPPRGNVTIAKALASACGKGIVFGGIDEVLLASGKPDEVKVAVSGCLDSANKIGGPFILSQSATPFYDPLPSSTAENLILMMDIGIHG